MLCRMVLLYSSEDGFDTGQVSNITIDVDESSNKDSNPLIS